jgi:hypothetical protein
MEKVVHGYNATITLTDGGISLKPGVLGSILGGGDFLSEKHIPFSSITGVELKKGFPYIGRGTLQINTKGEVAGSKGNSDQGDVIDRNIIKFQAPANKQFEEITKLIMERVS